MGDRCERKDRAIGGGVDGLSSLLSLLGSAPASDGSAWVVDYDPLGVVTSGLTVYAVCADL